jgi:hypothetical protein
VRLFALLLAAALAGTALAAEPAKKADEPIANKMKKPGMKQGDVKKEADKKMKKMKPMLEQESQSMERAAPAPKR